MISAQKLLASPTAIQAVAGPFACSSTAATSSSWCSRVASTWSKPWAPTRARLSSEMRPLSATRAILPTPKRCLGPPSPGQCRDIGCVAGEHVVGDRDAVGGDEQADHDLRPIGTVVPAVAEGEGGKALRPTATVSK